MLVYDAGETRNPAALPRIKVDPMYSLAQRLLRVESEADKEEFIRGVAGLDPDAGKKKVLVGLVSGVLLAKVLKK